MDKRNAKPRGYFVLPATPDHTGRKPQQFPPLNPDTMRWAIGVSERSNTTAFTFASTFGRIEAREHAPSRRPAAIFATRYSQRAPCEFMEGQENWTLSTEGALCRANVGEWRT